jgi:hypothetical protein
VSLWFVSKNLLRHSFVSLSVQTVYSVLLVFIFISLFHSFIHQWLYSPLLGPGLFFSFIICFMQTVGLLGRVISPSQGQYLHAGQHKHRINTYTDIHALSGIRTHDPSVRASEACLRPRDHRHQLYKFIVTVFSVFLMSIYLWLYSPCASWPLFQFLNLYRVGITPWTGDEPFARPLPTRRTTQTQNKLTDIHASSGIRTHDSNIRAGEDGLCLRPRCHCARQFS